jgi:hypothetical protein
MRRPIVLVLSLLAVAVPSTALARSTAPGDGRLTVENGRGVVTLTAVGGVVAAFDSGELLVDDPVAGDGSGIVVTGADIARKLGPTKTLYRGENVHILVKSDRFKLRISAVGIYLGAVGHGTVTLDGSGFTDTGRYQLNGGTWQPLPTDAPVKIQLGTAVTTGGQTATFVIK